MSNLKIKLTALAFLLVIGCTDRFDNYELPPLAVEDMGMIALDGGEGE